MKQEGAFLIGLRLDGEAEIATSVYAAFASGECDTSSQ